MLLSLLLSEVLTPFTYASEGEVVSESVEAPAQEAVAEEPVDEVVEVVVLEKEVLVQVLLVQVHLAALRHLIKKNIMQLHYQEMVV